MARKLMPTAIAFATLFGAGPAGQPTVAVRPDQSAVTVPVELPVPDLSGRLSALSPANPEAYYLLAEEIAAELPAASSETAQARRLAQQLYVLAYELDQRRPQESRQHLGRAVCLALAAIAPAEADQRWLWALARAADPRTAGPTWAPLRLRPAPESLALDLCAVLGYSRCGEGRRAEQILGRPGVSELLDRYDALLSPIGISGGASSIRKAIAQWPLCPECKNRRIVTHAGENTNQPVLCHTCNGLPGAGMSGEELLLQLRLESALLSGIHRSWAAQAVADRASPLRDLDPAELAPTFGVDAAKPLWRDGQWVEVPPAQPETAPAAGG